MKRLAIVAALIVPGLARAGSIALPPDFTVETVARGITGATAFEIAPDGRVFICEQTGTLRVFEGGKLLPEPAISLKVDSFWERGLIGVALDPKFPENHFIYLCSIRPDPYPHHRISRFTEKDDRAVAGSEVVLFEGDDQSKIQGSYPAGHQGGAIHFGRDGMLYVAIGEQTAGAPAQDLKSLLGKILRIKPDGSTPEDNPFVQATTGKYRAIWALGFRNPFTFAVQPGTGRIFINDVGGNFEEVNEGFAGANYGWPIVEHGPTADPRFRGPITWYPVSSITGGTFCDGAGADRWPQAYRGKYFFMDFMKGWLKVLDPDHPRSPAEFATGLPRAVDLRFAPDGGLYILTRDMWVKDRDFRGGTGSLLVVRHTPGRSMPAVTPLEKIAGPPAPFPTFLPAAGKYTGPIAVQLSLGGEVRYTTDGSEPSISSPKYEKPIPLDRSAVVKARSFRDGEADGPIFDAAYEIEGRKPYGLDVRPVVRGLKVPLDPKGLPTRLSETGIFADVRNLEPAPGVIPYEVNAPLWSDGAGKRRWIALPGGDRIGFRPTGEWSFPRGTVLIKQFEWPGRRLETRLLVVDGTGSGYGVTYKWRADGSDADLLADGLSEDLSGRKWSYPSREDCLKCHTINAGFVLGPKTRQLNRTSSYPSTGRTDNQLRTWGYLGMLRPAPKDVEIPMLDRLVGLDEDAPLEARARSYLDANCANCHRPGANIPATFDARYDTPPGERKIIDGATVSDSLGVTNPRVVAPGDLTRSLLHRRLIQVERFPMPPLARNKVDERAAAVLADWIKGLE